LAGAHLGLVLDAGQLFRVVDGVKDVPSTLLALSDAGVLDAGEGDHWIFRSTTELETISARLEAAQARTVHQRIAQALERDLKVRFTLDAAERLEAHLFAAENRPRGAEVAELLAVRAAGLGLFDVAAEHNKRALAVQWRALAAVPAADKEERSRALLKLAAQTCQALAEVDPTAAAEVVGPLLKALPPLMAVPARVEALRQRGLVLSRLKRLSDAEASLDEALETLQAEYDAGTAAGLLVDLALVLEQQNDIGSAKSQLQEALRLFGTPGAAQTRRPDALLVMGRIAMRERSFGAAKEAFEQASADAKSQKRMWQVADAHALLAGLAQTAGEIEEALVQAEQASVIATSLGDPMLEARLRQQVGRILVAMGRRGDAAVVLQEAIALAERAQWDEGVGAAKQLLTVVA
jgi:tetratricopeptide (TPR) repeat protein